MKSLASRSILTLAAIALAACAQLGIPKPETFNQKTAVAYATITQVRDTATTLLTAKKITADDGMAVLTATDAARAGVDAARKMHATNPSAADARVQQVLIGLQSLATYLAARGGGG